MAWSLHSNTMKQNGVYTVKFEIDGDVPNYEGRVSVSRVPNHDFYFIQDIAQHNDKGPSFQFIEGAKALISRVEADIELIIEGKDPSADAAMLLRDEVWPKVGAPAGASIGEQPLEDEASAGHESVASAVPSIILASYDDDDDGEDDEGYEDDDD